MEPVSVKLKKPRHDFFKNCKSVIRAPGSFFWGGEHACGYGNVALVQAIPLYAYVGLEVGQYPDFQYEVRALKKNVDAGLGDINAESMEDISIESWQERDRVASYLHFWKKRTGCDCFKIKVWLEVIPKCGLNSSGALAASLSSLLYMVENHIGEEQLAIILKDFSSRSVRELKANSTFMRIFKTAWILDDCFHDFQSSGAGPFSSIVGSAQGELLAYFTERRSFNAPHRLRRLPKNQTNPKPDDYAKIAADIDRINFWGSRVSFPSAKLRERLGIMLVYSGEPKATGQVLEKQASWMADPVKSYMDSFFSLFDRKEFDNIDMLPCFVRDMLSSVPSASDSGYYAKNTFTQSLGLLPWKLLMGLQHEDVGAILETVNSIHHFLVFYGVFGGGLRECLEYMTAKATGPLGVKLTGAGGGGDLVVIGNRDILEALESQIQRDGTYRIHYSSRILGWGAKSVELLAMPLTGVREIEKKVHKDSLDDRKTKPKELPEYEVYEGSIPAYLATATEVRKLHKRQNDFTIFINLVNKSWYYLEGKESKPIELQPGSLEWYFLSIALQRPGGYWGSEELHNEIVKQYGYEFDTELWRLKQRLNAATKGAIETLLKGQRRTGGYRIEAADVCVIKQTSF